MNKVFLYITIFLLFFSCKEKPKPFTYDYVEIGFRNYNECCVFATTIMIDSLKNVYCSDIYGIDDTFRIDHTNKCYFSDSLQNMIDKLAKLVYNEKIDLDYQNHIASENTYTGATFCFIVLKDGIKKEYRKFPNGQKKFVLVEQIEYLLKKDAYKIIEKNIDTIIEYLSRRELIAPPPPPPPPPPLSNIK